MRVPIVETAKEGRRHSLSNTFREFLRARMLWGIAGVTIMGILGGFLFYRSAADTPLPNQPISAEVPADKQPLTSSDAQEVAGTQTEQPSSTTDTPRQGIETPDSNKTTSSLTSSPTCDETAKAQAITKRTNSLAKEQERYKPAGTLNQMVTYLTAGLLSSGEAGDQKKHDEITKQIESDYQKALKSAHCS